MNTITSYILKSIGFSWDSDHYEEYTVKITFSTKEDLEDFYKSFMAFCSKRKPDWEMSGFGDFVTVESIKPFIEKYKKEKGVELSHNIWFDSGGISIRKVSAFSNRISEFKLPKG